MDFYYMAPSAPCRGPELTMAALGLSPNMKLLNLRAGEHMKPEFIAINPQHTVPTVVDGDFTLWESRVICAYLVNKYGKDDTLYPKNPKKRAQVDRLLYFDMGTLYHRFMEYVFPVLFKSQSPDSSKLEKLQEALGYLNKFLEGNQYSTGDNITIADHSLVATVSTFAAAGIDLSKHSNVVAWLARCKSNMPGYAKNEEGANAFGEWTKGKF